MIEFIKNILQVLFSFHSIESTNEIETMRPIPQQAIELIKKYEGFRAHAYQDTGGIWTIGYGTTESVTANETITEECAEERLREYLQEVGPMIIKLVKKPLNNNEYSALLSFVYNVGIGAFQHSTLLKLINSEMPNNIVSEFLKWNKDSKGHILQDLSARRQAEAALYFTPLHQIQV